MAEQRARAEQDQQAAEQARRQAETAQQQPEQVRRAALAAQQQAEQQRLAAGVHRNTSEMSEQGTVLNRLRCAKVRKGGSRRAARGALRSSYAPTARVSAEQFPR